MTMRFLSRRRIAVLTLLAVPSALGVWAWRTASWRPKIALIVRAPILALAWSSNGQTLRCASGDAHYRKLSGSTLEVLRSIGAKKQGWNKAAFSVGGRWLLTTDGSNTQLWNVSPMKSLGRRSTDGSSGQTWTPEVDALDISSHGDHLILAESFGNHGSVWICAVKDGHPQPLTMDGGCVYTDVADTVALSPDGQLVAYGGETPGIGAWSQQAGKNLWDGSVFTTATRPKMTAATALRFSPDGQLLAASFLSGETMLLESRTGTVVRTFDGVVPNHCLAFSPDSQLLSCGDEKGGLKVWNVATGQSIIASPSGTPRICSLAFSPDGSHLAVGTSTGQIQLWRVR